MERAIARVLDSGRAEAARLAADQWRREEAEKAKTAAEVAERERQEQERVQTAKAAAERAERERRRHEEAEKARMVAESAKRERQERERVQAAKAAVERAERERRHREEAEKARLAAEREEAQAEQQRLAREKAERRNREQAVRQAPRQEYGGTTRARHDWKLRRRVLIFCIVGAFPLAAVWFLVAHYAENPSQAVARAPQFHPGARVTQKPRLSHTGQATANVPGSSRMVASPAGPTSAKAAAAHTIDPVGSARPRGVDPTATSQPEGVNTYQALPAVENNRDELAWEGVDQSDPAALQAFARQYPDSAYAPKALSQAEQLGVGQALALFTRAIGQKDEALLKEVWPAIPPAILDKWRATFQNARSIGIDLHPGKPQMAGTSASVECRSKIQQVYPGDSQTYSDERTMRIALQKQGNDWKIVSVR
jgi:hypothetical protein